MYSGKAVIGPLLMLSLALLAGCGGGGDTPSAVPSSEGSVETVDGGKSSPSGAVKISRSSLTFAVFRRPDGSYGGVSPSPAVGVNVSFTGDGVIVGFAPGVARPSWLKVQGDGTTPIVSPTQSAELPVGVDPSELPAGTYTSSLRFVTGKLGNESSLSYVDLPISVTVVDSPAIYSGEPLNFEAKEGEVSGSQSVKLDFGKLKDVQVSTLAGNINSNGATWMQTSLDAASRRVLTVSLKPGVITGSYEGYAVVRYAAQGASDNRLIPVRLKVVPSAPVVTYATPGMQYAQQSANVIIRGRGFAAQPVLAVTLGGQAADEFRLINDSEIYARFASSPAVGKWPVQVQFKDTSVTAPGLIEVRPAQILNKADLDLGEAIWRTRYDAARQALLVRTETRLLRLAQVEGTWKVVVSREMRDFNAQFDFTPDGSQILMLRGYDGFLILDAETLQTVDSIDLPNPVTGGVGGYASVSLEGVMNNGDVVLLAQLREADKAVFAVYHLFNNTMSWTTLMTPYRAALPSYYRDKLLFIQRLTGWGETGFVGYYSAETGDFVPVALPINSGTEGQYSFSADGNVVELTREIYTLNGGLNKAATLTFPDKIDSNGDIRLSSDGSMIHFVSATEGRIRSFRRQGGQLTETGQFTFAGFNWYAGGTEVYLTPDNQAMVLAGGYKNGTGGRETRVVIVPLR